MKNEPYPVCIYQNYSFKRRSEFTNCELQNTNSVSKDSIKKTVSLVLFDVYS